ncbi:uncharacterized protein K444DRAFT_617884 [Hyaloscypha bicolor E]|uniref:P-loop containing nucleoside triphosphate hydrolase protein n=1 Tax=Hyaloscypha bicolor E TaxID=1095630 RepID=A0A2J6SUU1_9HELO|nr:uncharacterized protein K444DRAFT_617884 [Hyaloscypha bicolor E]PMD54536.1 hypothetical protein K444DRAFT_617884 [Hyaloscypha bicolor E]
MSNEPGTKIAEPRRASYDAPTAPEPCPAIKNADIEMTDEWSHHDSCRKQKNRTPSDSSQGDAYNATPVLVKFEKVDIKTEVESQIKAEFEPEAGSPKISDITEPAQKQNENEGGAKTAKQPRRTPAKTAFEYHKRKQEDSIGGIRKVRKTVRNVDPEKLLHSISHQDPVTAYNAGPSNGAAPAMAVSTKKAFFQEILSSCKDKDAFQKFKTDLNILDEESRSFGFKRMQMKNGMWQLKGMKSPVYHYQMSGAAWMVKCECSSEGPLGGILADAMGLGKTVTSITTMMANPPPPDLKKKFQRTTLIIVPRSVLHQWKAELETHGKFKKVLIYNNSDTDNNMPRRIVYNEVVLTTYNVIRMNFPNLDNETMERLCNRAAEEERSLTEVIQDWVTEKKKDAGCLHNIHWYRIILDEAHFIKNPSAKTTLAVLALKSHYRWALSGTPAQNGPEDYYPLFCFIRDPEISKLTFSDYRAEFCGPEQTEKLGLAISKVTICRTLEDSLFGKKLVNLPPPHTEPVTAKTSDAERLLYTEISARLVELGKGKLDDDNPQKELSNRLAQITCLRQLTAHPDLIEKDILLMFDLKHLQDLQDKLSKVERTGKSRVLLDMMQDRVKNWVARKKASKGRRRPVQRRKYCIQCKHSETEDLWIISICRHLICTDCLDNLEETVEDDEVAKSCPRCQSTFYTHNVKECQAHSMKKSKRSTSGNKGRDALKFRPSPAGATDWLKRLDTKKSRLQLLPTTKLTEIIDRILSWKEEYPRDKCTIFTQWNHFAVILGVLLQKEKIKFVYITGSMTSQQRTRAVQEFHGNKQVHVMIMGLKAGGLGLNLTCANRGILVDRWWNEAVENQAHGRIYRIGQKKPTTFVTIVVEDTVDDDVVDVQREKQEGINSVMEILSKEQEARLDRHGVTNTEEDGVSNSSESGDDESMENLQDEYDDENEDDDEVMDETDEDEITEEDESDGDIESDEDDGS